MIFDEGFELPSFASFLLLREPARRSGTLPRGCVGGLVWPRSRASMRADPPRPRAVGGRDAPSLHDLPADSQRHNVNERTTRVRCFTFCRHRRSNVQDLGSIRSHFTFDHPDGRIGTLPWVGLSGLGSAAAGQRDMVLSPLGLCHTSPLCAGERCTARTPVTPCDDSPPPEPSAQARPDLTRSALSSARPGTRDHPCRRRPHHPTDGSRPQRRPRRERRRGLGHA